MRAVIVETPGDVDALTIGQIETPTPGAGEILVRTVASGVNRADVLQRQGHYPPPRGESETIGLEASGVVEAVGEGVTRWKVGDDVVALLAGGGYAEYFVVPEGQAIAPPPGVDLVSAAGVLEVAATVLSNTRVGFLKAGQVFLVHGGAGGIGTFAIQYAKAIGATVIATAGSAEKLEHCRKFGADYAFDYHDDWVAAVKEATGGADMILDIMGAKYLELNVASLRRGGHLVIIGLQGGAKGTLNIGSLLSKGATVAATSLRYRPMAEKAEICAAVEREIWPLLRDGRVRLSPETRIPFDEVRRAHEQLVGGQNVGKIVLVH